MKKKVFVAIPTTDSIVDSQVHVLREMAELYKDHIELVYPANVVRRKFHDFARNMLVEEFLASDCDVLWFLDSDITPSLHALDLVALHYDKWQLSGATYPVFMMPASSDSFEVVYTAYEKNPATGALSLKQNVPHEGSEFVDGLATGCLFIKREVFTKLSKPYFEFKFKPETRDLAEGEDLGFCRKVNELGYKFYVDYSIICRHQKLIDLHDVNNYAISYANRSVLRYAEQVKETITPAMQAMYDKGYRKALEDLNAKLQQESSSKSKVLWTP